MIITLTGNLLAERTFDFSSWQPGKTQRATSESFQVGGKGINVSKMLTHLGARNIALCFAGGATGDECLRWLRERGFAHHAFRIPASTRAGTVVRTSANAQPETTFLGPDVPPDARSLVECAAWLSAQPVSHTLAFCGSFPGWDSDAAAPLREAIARRVQHNNVYVDTYGPPLAWFVAQPVALVKINRVEFDQLCANTKNSEHFHELAPDRPMADRLAAACACWPVRRWVITDGPGPVWFAAREGADDGAESRASVPTSVQPPPIREVSATGSGDVLFAAIIHSLKKENFTLADSVLAAIPYAAANASNHGIAEINNN